MFKRAYLNKRITDNPVKMASPEFKKEEEKEMRVMSKEAEVVFGICERIMAVPFNNSSII